MSDTLVLNKKPIALKRLQTKPFKFNIKQATSLLRPYVMIAPSLLILSLFVLYPIGYMVYLSFFKWNLIGEKVFVGLQNFTYLIADKDTWTVLRNTATYTFWTVLLSISLALLLALYLKKGTFVNRILQSIVFSPYIISLVSVSFVWMWMMDNDYGLINALMQALHLPKLGWLTDTRIAIYSLVIVSVWKNLGYNALIIISAMQAIPSNIYEAAKLDKTKGIRTFYKITFPMVSPTLFFLLLMDLIASFKVFETVNIMTNGGPVISTTSLVFSIYQYGFRFHKIGYASALGVFLMIIIAICTLLYFRVLSKKVYYR